MIRLSRTLHFNAGRSLWRRDWSEKKNREVYGDEGPHGFGHNFRLDVSVEGPLDPESAMGPPPRDLSREIGARVRRLPADLRPGVPLAMDRGSEAGSAPR